MHLIVLIRDTQTQNKDLNDHETFHENVLPFMKAESAVCAQSYHNP